MGPFDLGSASYAGGWAYAGICRLWFGHVDGAIFHSVIRSSRYGCPDYRSRDSSDCPVTAIGIPPYRLVFGPAHGWGRSPYHAGGDLAPVDSRHPSCL